MPWPMLHAFDWKSPLCLKPHPCACCLSLSPCSNFPNPNPSRTARRKIRPRRGSPCSLVHLTVSAVTCLPPPLKESSREGENRARPRVPLPQLRRVSPSNTATSSPLRPRCGCARFKGESWVLPASFSPSLVSWNGCSPPLLLRRRGHARWRCSGGFREAAPPYCGRPSRGVRVCAFNLVLRVRGRCQTHFSITS